MVATQPKYLKRVGLSGRRLSLVLGKTGVSIRKRTDPLDSRCSPLPHECEP